MTSAPESAAETAIPAAAVQGTDFNPSDDTVLRRDLHIPSSATIIYTDGACPSNGTAAGRAGIGIFFGLNDPRNISARLPGNRQTNQRAELFAVLKTLETLYQAGRQGEYVILTDSMYVIQALTEWAINWERSGWRNASGRLVVSHDLFKRARDLMRRLSEMGIPVSFRHVPGHSGIWGNEMADRLAVAGAHMQAVLELDWDPEFDDDELDAMAAEMENV